MTIIHLKVNVGEETQLRTNFSNVKFINQIKN